MKKIILSKNKEAFLRRKHPWIFSGAIKKVEGNPEPGETVEIITSNGESLGKGAFSPHSQIRARLWSFDKNDEIDKDFFYKKIHLAVERRKELKIDEFTNAYRLIFSEADGLPGLIVDKYDDHLVCQFLSAGAEFHKRIIVEILLDLLKPNCIYNRSDSDVRKKEGLPIVSECLFGIPPAEPIMITEGKLKMLVDLIKGHKTGFYLDQQDNRKIVSEYSKNKTMLNCFSYTGGFGLSALYGGANKVINVDTSDDVLKLAKQNFMLNEFEENKYELINTNVFDLLREYRAAGKTFDMIVLDPPKFVDSKDRLIKASRGYKDINMLAFQLLNKNGLLITFSCSGLVDRNLFQKIVADAALDADKEAQIIRFLNQSPDHPVSLNFPEAAYLKGLICRVF